LVYLDGLDYRHDGPDVGSAGGESLALVTGLGGQLAELDGTRPYLRPRDTVVVGLRPGDEYAGEAAGAGLHLIDAPTVRRDPVLAADQALRRLEHADLDGFWVHIDADVIDGELLRAVDSPEPDGLTFDELATVVRRLLASPRVVGVDVTIYDPDRDTDLHGGQQLTDALVKAFAN
jgi:arginase